MTDRRQRAQRSDAKANRERILAAAERIFDDRGIDISVSAIIRELGIGTGTFYRHFPTLDDLRIGIYDRLVGELRRVADDCTRESDSWRRIEIFLDGLTDLLLDHPAIPALMRHARLTRPDHDPAAAFREPVRRIVADAKQDGHLRPDCTATDTTMIPFLLASWSRNWPPQIRREMRDRAKAILVAGITRLDGPPLPGAPAGADEFRDAVHGAINPRDIL